MSNFKNKDLAVKTGNKPAIKKKKHSVTMDVEENQVLNGVHKSNTHAIPVSGSKINGRKKAGEAIRNSEEKQRLIMNAALDAVICINTKGDITFWNQQAELIFGWKHCEAMGKPLSELIIPGQYRKRHNEGMLHYLKTGNGPALNKLLELSAIKRSGEEFPIELTIMPIKQVGEEFFCAFVRDITERKKSETALQKAYEEKNTVLESIDDGFFALDKDSVVTYWNKRAEILLDTKKEDLIGKNLHEVFVARGSRIFYDNYVKALREKITIHFEGFSNLSKKWFAVSAYGSDNGLSVYFKDVTEQKDAGEKIKESELCYRSLIEQATDTICILDASGKFVEMNPSGCRLFGYSREEILQLFMTDVLFEEDLKINPIRIDELEAGKTTSNERRIKRKDGTTVEVELSAKMIEDGRIIVFGRDISERKESERLIKESEAKYRSFFESSMDGILLTVTDGAILSANPAACEIFKMTEEEICTAGRFGVADLSDPRLYSLIEERQRTGRAKGELTLLRKDGSKFEAELTSAVFTDSYGRDRTSMIVRDITERKQAEQSLRESNERYNLISKATNDMVWDWDLVTGNVYRNKEGWKKIFRNGVKESEIGSTDDWDSRVHPEDVEKVKRSNEEIQDSVNDLFEVECRMLRNDGTYAYVLERGNIIRDSQGKAVRLIGATQDITERKEAELQVAKSELRFRSLVQNSSDIICIFNDRGYFTYSSPAIKKVLGFEPEDTIEKNAFAFLHPDDINPLKDYLLQMKPDMHQEMPLLRFKNSQGEWRWIESRVTNMCDNPEIAGYVFNCRDVTERKIAEAEIEKLSFIARETGNAVIITNPAGEIVWVNEGFTKITDFEFDEVTGKKPGDFLQGPETNLAVVRFMRNKLRKAEPFECDILNYSKSGRKYWLRIQSQPQYDETGKLKYFFAIETDITKEKEAEEILKASEERYRYLFNNNPASIIIWDIENLQILEINQTSVGMYGYCREEFLTKTILDIRLPQQYDKVKQFASMARQKTDFVSTNSWKHINKAGEEMYMNIASHRIQFKGRPVILSLATNITDKIFLEKELEKERLAKQQEITDAVISAQEKERQELGAELHDNVNQILAGSLLYLGLAKKELKVEHPYLSETDTLINTAITEIRNLAHSLIVPSLHESELLAAIDNIIDVTQQTGGIMINMQAYDFDESNMPDKLKLSIYRIVQEQFNNILKHAGAQKVIVRLVQENEKTLLSIKDDGAGFDTNKKTNGVGLMNMKTRASLFNGELNIISSPGKGCELRVLFN
jgi:PAS domain S-box-containing protein